MVKTTFLDTHNTYGGHIAPSDYDRETSIADIADRIISDWKFDERCRKQSSNRKNVRKEK